VTSEHILPSVTLIALVCVSLDAFSRQTSPGPRYSSNVMILRLDHQVGDGRAQGGWNMGSTELVP